MDHYVPPKVEHVQVVEVKQMEQQESSREHVRRAYGRVAEANTCGKACGRGRSCCGVPSTTDVGYAVELGYSEEELKRVPEGSNMGLGCGNPLAIAALKRGDYVLDLGAGGGLDVFLAAERVGPGGRVFGVDMTPEMVSKARANAKQGGYPNVDFLLGEIEHLPLADSSIDVIISNCVVNLSTDKEQVFREAFRVLKEGGRLAISDMVAHKPLPSGIATNPELYCACIAGAITVDELKGALGRAGFENIEVVTVEESKMFIKDWAPEAKAEDYVVSAKVTAVKPAQRMR